jgi:hypothetical protein
MGGRSEIAPKRINGRGDPTYLFQLQGPIDLSARGDHVDVFKAKLSRLPLPRRVGQYGDQHLDLRGPCSWVCPVSWLVPGAPKGRGRQPLGKSARTCLWLLVPISSSHRKYVPVQGLSALVVSRGGSPYLRM